MHTEVTYHNEFWFSAQLNPPHEAFSAWTQQPNPSD